MDVFISLTAYLAGLTLGTCSGIIVHEFGHLVFGRLTGYRFVSFRLLHWLWAKDKNGKLKLTTGSSLGGALGQCLLAPCEDEARFRFVLYNAGGALANLVISIGFLIPFFRVNNEFLSPFLFGMGLSNLLISAMNLIPMKKAVLPNDGTNIKEARKSTEAAHSLYLMLKVNAEMSAGKRITDYEEDAFAVSACADCGNYLVAYTFLLRSNQLEESGRFEESYAVLQRPEPTKLPMFYAAQFILALMFHELVHFGDEASVALARQRIEAKAKDKAFQKIMQMKHPGILPLQAAKCAFVDDDIEKARAWAAQARELAPTLQSPGQEHSIALLLERLAARMERGIP